MSKASAVASISHALLSAVPAISQDIIDHFTSKNQFTAIDSKNWTSADADDALRAIIKLDALRQTKNIQYKSALDRYEADKKETLNMIDAVKYSIQKPLLAFAKLNLEGKHCDLPSGRIQLHGSKSVEIKIDDEELQKVLMKCAKSDNAALKSCVRIKLEPDLNAIKAAIAAGTKIDWAEIINSDSPTFTESANVKNESESPVGESVSALGPITESVSSPRDPVVAPKATATPVTASAPVASTAQAEPPSPASEPAPAPAPVQLANTSPTGPGSAPSAPDGSWQTTGTNPDLRPRYFEAPKPHHFVESALKVNAMTFEHLEIPKLLEGQDRVKIEHITGLKIDQIKGGMVTTLDKLKFSKDDRRTWIAYHLGKNPSDIDSSKLDDNTWRKLLAMAVHATVILEKYPNRSENNESSAATQG